MKCLCCLGAAACPLTPVLPPALLLPQAWVAVCQGVGGLMAALALHGGWTVLRQALGELGEDSAKDDRHGHVH